MARKFLTAIDLGKNELQNAAVQNLASAPASPVKGQLYFNSTGGDNTLYWWDGTAWVAAKSSGAAPSFGPIVPETTFGGASADGVATTVARSDHKHGTPTHDSAAHSAIPLNALATATAAYNMGGFKITNLGTPSGTTDATTKTYVDSAITNAVNGLQWKAPVQFATTANITLSGTPTIDGSTTLAGMHILVKNQTTASENGVYITAAGAWTRRTDMDVGTELPSAALYVSSGSTQADTSWVCTNDVVSLGSSAVTFVQTSGPGAVGAGAGLTQTGNTLDVIGDASITVAADKISRAALTGDVTAPAGSNTTTIANVAVTNAKLASMGFLSIKGNNTISAAAPKDLTIPEVQGMLSILTTGTAAQTYTVQYEAPCAAALSTLVAHNLNNRSVVVLVYRNSTPWDDVECDIERTDLNNVTVRFAVAPAASEYQIVVMGVNRA